MSKRYIDAYALENRVENFEKLTRMKLDIVHDFVSSEPTADVRENIKGEWVHDEVTMNGNTVYTPNAKCSICDCYVFQESNFCPNCGADMRGES